MNLRAFVVGAMVMSAGAARADAPEIVPGAVTLSGLSETQLAHRAVQLEDSRPFAVSPVALLVGGGLVATAGIAGTALAVTLFALAASAISSEILTYVALACAVLVPSAGLSALGLSMLRVGTQKVQQRAMVDEELADIRLLRAPPMMPLPTVEVMAF